MTWLFFKKVFFFRCWSLSLRKQLRNKYVPNIFYTCLSSAIPPPAWTSSCHSIAVTCDMALGKPAKLEFFGKKSPDDGYMNHESSWLVKNKDSSKWFIEIILGLVESHPSKSLYNLKNLFFIDHWKFCVFFSWPISRTFLPKACDRRPPPLTGNQGRMWPSRRWCVYRWTVDGPSIVRTKWSPHTRWSYNPDPSYSFIGPFTNNQFLDFV